MIAENCFFCGAKATFVGLDQDEVPLHFVCDKHKHNKIPGPSGDVETHRRQVLEDPALQFQELTYDDTWQEGDETSWPGQDWTPVESGFGGSVRGLGRRPLFTVRAWDKMRGQLKKLREDVQHLEADNQELTGERASLQFEIKELHSKLAKVSATEEKP